MNKTVKIAIYIAALFLVSIWMSSVIKSCNAPNDLSTTEIESTEEELDEFEEDFFEDNLGSEDYDSDMGGGSVDESTGTNDFVDDYNEVDKALENVSSTTDYSSSNNTYVEKPRTKSTSQYGKYMVLAGSYLIEDNANSMVRKLDKLGYENGEVVVFNMSQYHSVCAARLTNYNEAIQISNELKRKGIDNYVHKKQ